MLTSPIQKSIETSVKRYSISVLFNDTNWVLVHAAHPTEYTVLLDLNADLDTTYSRNLPSLPFARKHPHL